ncbi:hypothetical protein [Methylomarinum vadi]|uniref:hypothetical protein n=1 Tax=Methylomarinum vadi TaxID=438855 RepID=UPI0005621C40|nr:hypothetical protein [Methylomarinum vadi]
MAKINTKDLVPGMVLAKDAEHANGRVLLKAGAQLNENHIKVFKTWGINNVEITTGEDNSVQPKQDYSADEIKRALDKSRVKFQHCDMKQPLINELFRISAKNNLKNRGTNNR